LRPHFARFVLKMHTHPRTCANAGHPTGTSIRLKFRKPAHRDAG
jgi:hypothetical protein